MISSRFCSSTTRSLWYTHTVIIMFMLSASLASFAKCIWSVFCDEPVQNWYDVRPTHCFSSFKTNYRSQTRTPLVQPKLTNLFFKFFLVKVLRKPIPWIHHIKIKHYIPQSIFFGHSTSRNILYIISFVSYTNHWKPFLLTFSGDLEGGGLIGRFRHL